MELIHLNNFKSFEDFIDNYNLSKNAVLFYSAGITRLPQTINSVTYVYFSESGRSGEVTVGIIEKINKTELKKLIEGGNKIVSKNQIKLKKLPIAYYTGKIKAKFKKGDKFKSLTSESIYKVLGVRNSSVKYDNKDKYCYTIQEINGSKSIFEINENELLKLITDKQISVN